MAIKDFTYSDFQKDLNIDDTGNVEVLYDEDAIQQSLRNLISTIANERVRNPIGSTIVQQLFKNMSSSNAERIQTELRRVINTYETRVNVVSVNVIPDFNKNIYDIEVLVDIRRINRRLFFESNLRQLG